MRISDKQRREVAARLRADHRQDHESQVTFIARMVTGKDRVTVVDVLRLPKTLADLIDRPTCSLDLTDVETYGNAKVRIYECSECGRSCEEMYGEYERCPHCGARVVRDDD